MVNMTVDGQHSVAYRLPIARQRGALEVITFDAKAEFMAFELFELSPTVVLSEASSSPANPSSPAKPVDGPLPVDQAKFALTIAEKTLATAEAQPVSIRARVTADRARLQEPPSPDVAKLVADAVRAERLAVMEGLPARMAAAGLAPMAPRPASD